MGSDQIFAYIHLILHLASQKFDLTPLFLPVYWPTRAYLQIGQILLH